MMSVTGPSFMTADLQTSRRSVRSQSGGPLTRPVLTPSSRKAGSHPHATLAIHALKTYFKAYATSDAIRHIIESGHLTDLATNPIFSTKDFRAVPAKYRALIPEYIKDYVSLNQFTA